MAIHRIKLIFCTFLFSLNLVATTSKADNFSFAVVAAAPSSFYTKSVVVDVYALPSVYPWGWRNFYLNIDGYNYPIYTWNQVPIAPGVMRAWFNIPNSYWGVHRLQLLVEFWAQPFFGYAVPVSIMSSYPQFYTF